MYRKEMLILKREKEKLPKGVIGIALILVLGALPPMLDSTIVNIAVNDLAKVFSSHLFSHAMGSDRIYPCRGLRRSIFRMVNQEIRRKENIYERTGVLLDIFFTFRSRMEYTKLNRISCFAGVCIGTLNSHIDHHDSSAGGSEKPWSFNVHCSNTDCFRPDYRTNHRWLNFEEFDLELAVFRKPSDWDNSAALNAVEVSKI